MWGLSKIMPLYTIFPAMMPRAICGGRRPSTPFSTHFPPPQCGFSGLDPPAEAPNKLSART